MNAAEVHPEELLDRARRGAATEAEKASIAEHLAQCVSCRFESRLASDAANDAVVRTSDELVLARLRRNTARALLARGVRPRRARRARALLLVAATLLIGGASVAGVLGYRALSSRIPAPPAPAAPAARPAEKQKPHQLANRNAAAETPSPQSSAAVEAPSEPGRGPALQGKRSPAELFAEANRARRAGDVTQAARGYRELTQRYPGSAEALVARVSFGRLLLDRLGNARGALAEFDSYLGNSSHRALREEALIGRAVALGRLGRGAEERAAWRTLLRAYPGSTYASRARTRLEELDGPASAP